MSHPLDGIWAKIERVNENIKNVSAELDRFLLLNSDHYHTEVERVEETKEFVLKAYGDPLPIPLRLQVLTGEIIHHLRSGLDHLVWALVLRKHPNPSWNTQFPICESPEKYRKACNDGIIKGVATTSASIIEAEQPYQTKEPKNHPLFILHRLSNIDKHRLLMVGYGVITSPNQISIDPGSSRVGIGGMSPPKFVLPTKEGAEVFRITFTEINPDTKVKFNSPPLMAFNEFGVSRLEPIIPGLANIRDHVTNTIKLFTGQFQ